MAVTIQNRNRLIVILVVAVPTLIFIGSIFYNAFHLPPPPPMPNPNGYDDLVDASRMLALNGDFYASTDPGGLAAIVATNAEALKLARAGLQKQCLMHVDEDYNVSAANLYVTEMKSLASAFGAEERLAEMQGRAADAAQSDLDIIHLANESFRGGNLFDGLVEISIERRGSDDLHRWVPALDAKTCRQVAMSLEMLDTQRQTMDDMIQQEDYWTRREFPGIRHEIARMMQYKEIQKVNEAAEQKFEGQQTRTRQLAIDFAVRAYKLDKGRAPATVADLVTNYLENIPMDPVTGTNMVYLPK